MTNLENPLKSGKPTKRLFSSKKGEADLLSGNKSEDEASGLLFEIGGRKFDKSSYDAMKVILKEIAGRIEELNEFTSLRVKIGLLKVLENCEADKNGSLTVLDLYGVSLSKDSLKLILPMLKNTHIERLDLREIELGDEGAEIIADFIKNHPLKKLVISGDLGKNGREVIAQALAGSSLETLYFTGQHIDEYFFDKYPNKGKTKVVTTFTY